jgi:hypothetical protein
MITCIICTADVSNPLDQYGPAHAPVCRSCWFTAELPCPATCDMEGQVKCAGCGGSGGTACPDCLTGIQDDCPTCEEEGFIYCRDCSGSGTTNCPTCRGRSTISADGLFGLSVAEVAELCGRREVWSSLP